MNKEQARTKVRAIQAILEVEQDGEVGNKTIAALNRVVELSKGITTGFASSFADKADVHAFAKCRQRGLSERYCFREGDNGIGKWGADTTADRPMCALPYEDWEHLEHPAGTLVLVTANGKTILAELQDTMPHRASITNGAVIDLNPAAVQALGLTPPIMAPAAWRWAPVKGA